MGTRSIIVITGIDGDQNAKTVRLYKHWDGYPSANLKLIKDAFTLAKQKTVDFIPIKTLSECFLALSDSRIDSDWDRNESESPAVYAEKFKPKHLGNQADLEWIYVVNSKTKTVRVYGGGYTGESPQKTAKKGTVNPESYVNCLIDECVEPERKLILTRVAELKLLGFKINPYIKRKTKS